MVKSNALEVQRLVVPWLIAMYGLTYAKSLKLNVIKQQIMAVAPLLGLLTNCKAAAEEFSCGFERYSLEMQGCCRYVELRLYRKNPKIYHKNTKTIQKKSK